MIRGIVLSGVGGQGLITLGKILGKALMKTGYYVKVAETHGLSQRGGSVIVHIKYSDEKYFSPTVAPGLADIYVSLELIEAVRNLYMVKKDAIIVVNDLILPPPASSYIPSREELLNELKKFKHLYIVNASKIASEIGFIAATNIVILGYLIGKNILDINYEKVVESLKETINKKYHEANIEALEKGYKIALK